MTMRERVGLLELSSFAKYELEGPGARDFLNGFLAGVVPKKIGSVRPKLSPEPKRLSSL